MSQPRVRRLLAGETVTFDGDHIHLDEVALEPPSSSSPPLLFGATGRKGLAVAGQHADGILQAPPRRVVTPESASTTTPTGPG